MDRRSKGGGTIDAEMQPIDAPKLDKLIDTMIEYWESVDVDEKGEEKGGLWFAGIVESVCGGTWVISGKISNCYKAV